MYCITCRGRHGSHVPQHEGCVALFSPARDVVHVPCTVSRAGVDTATTCHNEGCDMRPPDLLLGSLTDTRRQYAFLFTYCNYTGRINPKCLRTREAGPSTERVLPQVHLKFSIGRRRAESRLDSPCHMYKKPSHWLRSRPCWRIGPRSGNCVLFGSAYGGGKLCKYEARRDKGRR